MQSRLLRLAQRLPGTISSSFLRDHDPEPLKVIQSPSLFNISPLLRPRALFPLLKCGLLLEVLFDDA